MNDSKNNIFWLLAASAVAFFYWHNGDSQQLTPQLQKDLDNCQAEFKAFKDGLTYGRK